MAKKISKNILGQKTNKSRNKSVPAKTNTQQKPEVLWSLAEMERREKFSSLPVPSGRARKKKFQIFPDTQAFASGFGPDSKLANLLKKPLPMKAVGALSVVLAVCLVTMISSSIPKAKIDQTVAIKTATTKQLTALVAGGKPVQWSVLVKKSDITKGNYLAVLPKYAGKIKITTVTAQQADAILKTQTQQLTTKQKSEVAVANQPKSFFAASLLDSLAKWLSADLSGATQSIADAVDPNIQQTSDGTAVNLSNQAPTTTQGSSSNDSVSPAPTPTPAPDNSPATTPDNQTTTPAQLNTTALDADITSAQSLATNATIGTGPTDYAQSDVDALQSAVDSALQVENTVGVTQSDIDGAEQSLQAAVLAFKGSNQYVKVDYQTPAPNISEQNTDTGKLVTVSTTAEDPAHPVVDVLASTKIPKIFKVGQESKIHIKWKSNNNQNVTFTAYDTDSDGYLDYVEWTVPHLSEQEFQIIFISKAFQLDNDQNITADIYPATQTEDGNFATVPQDNYIRATFNDILDKTKDITIHAKPQNPSSNDQQNSNVQIFPVYTDQDGNQTEGPEVASIENITSENNYRAELTNLDSPTDTFDLKIVRSDLAIDYIVDPTAWLTGWAHRKQITVSHTNVASDLSNFPLLVKITADSDMASALSTGADIRFTDAGGRSTLYYERETWTGGNGTAVTANIWVNVPTVTSAADTVIYIYYGNAGASDGQSATNVWDSNYKGVWHLNDPTNPTDSTSNANNGANNGVTAAAGEIGGAGSFNGTSAYINSGAVTVSTAIFTVSAWVNGTSFATTPAILKGLGTALPIVIVIQPNGALSIAQFGYTGWYTSTNTITINTWHLITVVQTGGHATFYIDGNSGGTQSFPPIVGTENFIIGANYWGGYIEQWNGNIDETRISSIARDSAWIKFEYHNQADTGNNLTFANQENNLTWLSGWNNRKKITIDHTKVGSGTEDETNFPVLISLAGLTGINAGGSDIRFTTNDGGTYLPREIESYSSGNLTAWVKIPLLSHTADTVIYMYYGNSSATEPAASSTYGSQNVWTNGFAGVWHLPNGTTLSGADSTSGGFTFSTNTGTVTATSGQVYGGASFNGGGTQRLATANDIYANSVFSSGITMSAWVSRAGTLTNQESDNHVQIMSIEGYHYLAGMTATNKFGGDVAGDSSPVISTTVAAVNTFYYVTMTSDGSGNVKMYVNGNQENTGSQTYSSITHNRPVALGNHPTDINYGWNGTIDEARISSSARSAPWIATEYANQNSPSTFYTAGNTEGTVAPSNWLTGWSQRKKVTIKHTNVDENLTNFPLLVKFAGNTDLAGALSTGNDIRFTSTDGTTVLPYEKETWTGGAGSPATANFWVKIPTVSHTADTDIWMYYGNSGAADGAAPTSVWDSNYKGVWHLNDPTNPTDSTSNANNGTNHGVTATSGPSGLGGAGSFDTTPSSYISIPGPISGYSSALMLSGWVKRHDGGGNIILFKPVTPTGPPSYEYYDLAVDTDGTVYFIISSTTERHILHTTETVPIGNWANVIGRYDGSEMSVWISGIKSSATISVSLTIGNDTYPTFLGAGIFNSGFEGYNGYSTGFQDETRISSVARSASWIKFEYANMSSADNELSIEGYTTTAPGQISWTNGTGDNKWSTAGNWQGGVVPGTGDTAEFDSSATGNVTLDQDINVKGINIASGYTGTITQSGSHTITIGDAGFVQAGGVFNAGSANIILNGNGPFTADGTRDSTQFNDASLVLNGTNTINYPLQNYSDGFGNLTVGQGGNTTTIDAMAVVRNTLAVGSGTVTASNMIILSGSNPLSFDNSSHINVPILYFYGGTQTIPALANGYDSNILVGAATVTQTGNVVLNGGYGISVSAGGVVTNPSRWNTDGYNLTVGGNIQIGQGSDTALKKLDATHNGTRASTITVGGNWLNYGTGSAPSQFIADNSTVVFSGTNPNRTVTTGGSSFNNININDGLVGYWKMDETSGTTVHDSSGFGNDGTNNGASISASTAPTNFTNAKSLSFNGTSGFVDIGSLNGISGNNETVSLWAKPLSYDDFGGFIDSSFGGSNSTVRLYIGHYVGSGDSLTVFLGDGTRYEAFNFPNAILLNTWRHYTVSLDGENVKLYINGSLIGSQTTDLTLAKGTYKIGAGFGLAGFFHGNIDDVRIYNRALSAGEVAALAAGNEPATSVSTVTLGDNLNVAGNLTLNSGTLDASSGNNYAINVGGNWENNGGVFLPQWGTVTLNGANQSLNSSNIFYNLTKSVSSADTLTFGQKSTQTISHALTLNGASSNLLSLRSSTAGTQYNLNPQGTKSLGYLDIKDSNNANSTAISTAGLNITNSGNNTNWTFDSTPPVVTLTSPTNSSVFGTTVPFAVSATDDHLGSLVPNLDNSLVSWWRGENNATDYIGNNDGTLHGGVTYTTGKFGKGMSFDGTSGYVELTNSLNLTGDFTISAWTNYNSLSYGSGKILGSSIDGNVFVDIPNYTVGRIRTGAGIQRIFTIPTFLTGQFNQITVTRFNGNISFFVNGVESSTGSIADSGSVTINLIGKYGGGGNFPGSIDDVQIYNRALSADEVTALYNGTAISHTSTLSAGSHTYKAYAEDLAGNIGTSTTNTFTVDTTNPTTTISTPTDNSYATSTTVALTGTSSDNVGLSTTTISIDGGAFVATAGTAGSWTYSATGLSQGAHTFVSKATDLAGNTATSSTIHVTVDSNSPTVSTVTVQTGLTVDVAFSEAMGTGVTTASNYTVSGSGKGTLSTHPDSVALLSGNTYRLTWNSGEMLNGGAIIITVTNAQDTAGNIIGSPNSGTGTAVGSAPSGYSASLDQSYINNSNKSAVSFTYSGAEVGTTYNYSITGISGNPVTGSGTISSATQQISNLDLSGLSDGTVTLTTYLTDPAGNQGSNVTDTKTKDVATPTTTDNFANNNTWESSSQTITLTPTDASPSSGFAYTKYCVDTINTCVVSSGTAYTVPVVISTEGTSYFRYASADNAGNTQTTVSKTVKVDTTAPTTLADATPYNFGDWSNADVSVSLTCADGSGSGCLATYYCIDTTNTCTPSTNYTLPTTISSDGTTYIRYMSTDSVNNSETIQAHSINIDKTGPTIGAGSDQTKNAQFTQTGTVTAGSSAIANMHWSMVSGPGTVTFGTPTTATTTVSADTDGAYVIKLTVTDAAGNAHSANFNLVWDTASPVLAETTPVPTPATETAPTYTFNSTKAGAITYVGSCSSQTASATAGDNTITLDTLTPGTYSDCKIIVTDSLGNISLPLQVSAFTISSPAGSTGRGGGNVYYSASAPESSATTATTPTPAGTNVISQIGEQINGVAKQVSGLFAGKQPEATYPPIADSVPKVTPEALQGLKVMSVNPLGGFALSPVSSDIRFFANRLPQLKSTLNSLGIDASKVSDIKKLAQAQLYLPGLTQTILSPNEILKANQLADNNQPPAVGLNAAGQKATAGSPSLQANALASVQGVPVASLSSDAIAKIPTNLVFARTAGELVDLASALTVDNNGNTEQKITTISGKPIELVIKPNSKASKVTGLMTLTKLQTADNNTNNNAFAKIFDAALTAVIPSQAQQNTSAQNGLLVQKFDYKEIKPGVFIAEVSAPTAEGQYKITTVVEYKDKTMTPTATNLTAVVDPEGYVYEQVSGGKLRLQDASVSVHWLNSDTTKYELWPADKFMQKNPIVTDDTGKYSFLVPQGTYYLTASLKGCHDFKSDSFIVKDNNGVTMDIRMERITILPGWLNPGTAIIVLLVVVIILLMAIIVKKKK